jgi:hypothetical protein
MISSTKVSEARKVSEVRTFIWSPAQVAGGALQFLSVAFTWTARSLTRIQSLKLTGVKTATAGGAVTINPVSIITIVAAAQPGFITFPEAFNTSNNQPSALSATYIFGPSSPKRKTNIRLAQGSLMTVTLNSYDNLVLNDSITFGFEMEWITETNL